VQGRNFIPIEIDARVEEVGGKAESFIKLQYPNGVRLNYVIQFEFWYASNPALAIEFS